MSTAPGAAGVNRPTHCLCGCGTPLEQPASGRPRYYINGTHRARAHAQRMGRQAGPPPAPRTTVSPVGPGGADVRLAIEEMTQKLEFTADVLRRQLAAAGDLEHADQLRSEILQQVTRRESEAQELVAEAAQARLVAEEQRDQAQEEADQAAEEAEAADRRQQAAEEAAMDAAKLAQEQVAAAQERQQQALAARQQAEQERAAAVAQAEQRQQALEQARTEHAAQLQASDQRLGAVEQRAAGAEQRLAEAEKEHRDERAQLQARLEAADVRLEDARRQHRQEVDDLAERQRQELAALEARQTAQLEQERQAWGRAIAAAEELAKGRAEELAGVRADLAGARGERDQLGDQVRQLTDRLAASQPETEEEPKPRRGRTPRREA